MVAEPLVAVCNHLSLGCLHTPSPAPGSTTGTASRNLRPKKDRNADSRVAFQRYRRARLGGAIKLMTTA
jgi:hypothetical protein